MKIIEKVQMIVWAENEAGEPEFFVIKRPKQKDCVILTGKIADKKHIKNESIKDAAIRELREELNVKPIEIIDLRITNRANISKDVTTIEHPFLIKIATQNVKFLEYEANQAWIKKNDIINILSYDTQKNSLKKALEHF